jgi:hypothetical protein
VATPRDLTHIANELHKENERLKKELEEMKSKEYKSNYVWKLRVGGDVRGVRKNN